MQSSGFMWYPRTKKTAPSVWAFSLNSDRLKTMRCCSIETSRAYIVCVVPVSCLFRRKSVRVSRGVCVCGGVFFVFERLSIRWPWHILVVWKAQLSSTLTVAPRDTTRLTPLSSLHLRAPQTDVLNCRVQRAASTHTRNISWLPLHSTQRDAIWLYKYNGDPTLPTLARSKFRPQNYANNLN